jgi:hypothetical protein
MSDLIKSASREQVHAAVEAIPDPPTWEWVQPRLVPTFLRARPLPPGSDHPVLKRVPPGLYTAVGIDIGPAVMYVGDALLKEWGQTIEDALTIAIANVREQFNSQRMIDLEFGKVADVDVWWWQPQFRNGMASNLLLMPDELWKLVGEKEMVIVAPMKNLMMMLPADVDLEFARWLRDEVQLEDPNGINLPVMRITEAGLAVVDEPRGIVQ